MGDTKKTLQVVWHEGLLLTPQHLQQQDRFWQNHRKFVQRFIENYNWGFSELNLDISKLAEGVICINGFEAITAEGEVISDQENISVDLKTLKLEKTKPTVLYLIKEAVPSTENIDIVDDNNEANSVSLSVYKPKLKIDKTYPANPSLLVGPVLRVTLHDTHYETDNFLPPFLNIPKNNYWNERLKNLVNNLRQKHVYLFDNQEQGVHNEARAMLRSAVLILDPLTKCSQLSCNVFYNALRECACEMIKVYDKKNIPNIFPYNCLDPLQAIKPLFEIVETSLNNLQQIYTVLDFQQNDRLFYLTKTTNLNLETYIVCHFPKHVSIEGAKNWLQHAVIASDSKISFVTTHRVRGVDRQIIADNTLEDISFGSDVILAQLVVNNSQFFKQEENLNVFNPGDQEANRPLKIHLYVRKNDIEKESRHAA